MGVAAKQSDQGTRDEWLMNAELRETERSESHGRFEPISALLTRFEEKSDTMMRLVSVN